MGVPIHCVLGNELGYPYPVSYTHLDVYKRQVETPFVEIFQIVLYTSSGLGGVVVEVVYVDIPTPVCLSPIHILLLPIR